MAQLLKNDSCIVWPNKLPQRLFRFSPLLLHECVHHGMEAERDKVMADSILYENDWLDEDGPVAIIAWPDKLIDQKLRLLRSLIGEVEEFRLVRMEGDEPIYEPAEMQADEPTTPA